MRDGGTPTGASGGLAPSDDVDPPGHPRRRRRMAWASLGVTVALVAGVATWIGVRASSKPGVSGADVGKIVDKKVGKAVTDLQSAPPAGVGVFTNVRPELVVVETEG